MACLLTTGQPQKASCAASLCLLVVPTSIRVQHVNVLRWLCCGLNCFLGLLTVHCMLLLLSAVFEPATSALLLLLLLTVFGSTAADLLLLLLSLLFCRCRRIRCGCSSRVVIPQAASRPGQCSISCWRCRWTGRCIGQSLWLL